MAAPLATTRASFTCAVGTPPACFVRRCCSVTPTVPRCRRRGRLPAAIWCDARWRARKARQLLTAVCARCVRCPPPPCPNSKEINSIAFSPNGETLVTSSDDDSINIYNCKEGVCVSSLRACRVALPRVRVRACAVTPRARLLLSCWRAIRRWGGCFGPLIFSPPPFSLCGCARAPPPPPSLPPSLPPPDPRATCCAAAMRRRTLCLC